MALLPTLDAPPFWDYTIGDHVGVLGYPFGTNGMVNQAGADPSRIYRVGPVLQQGYISAIAPHDGSDHVERMLLDIRTTRGMSGGAVFCASTGVAIGVHTSGFGSDASDAAVLAFAAPLTQSIVDALTEQLSPTAPLAAGERRELAFQLPTARRSPRPAPSN